MVVACMIAQARLAELQKSEVSVAASGLCPFSTGSHSDPNCGHIAEKTGFWLPWCDEGYTCVPGPAPTPGCVAMQSSERSSWPRCVVPFLRPCYTG